jgi:hypothetical protein|tara:strand:+ start:9479 stop:10489 length:1011 start_codon:yes stop_codon:yes gene_type:complete
MSSHEDNIKKEFEESEGIIDTKAEVETKTNDDGNITNLGKVDTTRGSGITSIDDPEIQRIQSLTGYIKLDLSVFPSGGQFYRDDFQLHIRAARVGEIREFSTLDEENILDVDEKLNSLLVNCTKIMYGTQRGSYRDVLEEDRIYLILCIRELTFKEGENKLMMPVGKTKCKTGTCKSQEAVELRTDSLQFNEADELLEKYYDATNKCFTVPTKNHGEIVIAPPTIGVMRSVTDWIRQREEQNKPWDKSSLAILPYIQREWRGFKDKEIFSAITSFQGWDSSKYSIIYRLVEKAKIGVKPEFNYPCDSCGEEVTVPLTFPGGIKALFIIQDISAELL